MKVSVIIPIYNVEHYICRCLASVISQQCEHFAIECVLVDDCSPDASMDVARALISDYQGSSISFKIVRHDTNKGVSVARNSGIREATGDFLYFLDSDDEMLEGALRKLVDYAVSYPDADVIMGNTLYVGNNTFSNTALLRGASEPLLIADRMSVLEHCLRRRIDRNVWNKLIRRSVVVDNRLFFEKGLIFEDVIWTYALYSHISSLLVVPDQTYVYENNPTSLLHTSGQHSAQTIQSLVFVSNSLLDNPPRVRDREVLFSAHAQFVYHWILRAVDFEEKWPADSQTGEALNKVKRRLFRYSVTHIRPFLWLYFLTMFSPFCQLVKWRAFRVNIERIDRLVYKLSSVME